MSEPKKKLLSLAGVARRLDVPYARARRLFHAGALPAPFFGANDEALFPETQLPEIRRAVLANSRRRL